MLQTANRDLRVTRCRLGESAIEILASDSRLADMVGAGLGTGFAVSALASSLAPTGEERRIKFDQGSHLGLEGEGLHVGVSAEEFRAPVLLYYRVIESSLVTVAASLGFTGLHASSVMFRSRLILLLGERGAGKSTGAVALMRAGGRIVSDDASYVRPVGDRCLVTAYPREAHLDREICMAWQIIDDASTRAGYADSRPSTLPVGRFELARTAERYSVAPEDIDAVFLDGEPGLPSGAVEALPADLGWRLLTNHLMPLAPRFDRFRPMLALAREDLRGSLGRARFWRMCRPAVAVPLDGYVAWMVGALEPLFT